MDIDLVNGLWMVKPIMGLDPDGWLDDDGLFWCENDRPLFGSFTWINDRGNGELSEGW